MIRRLQHEQAGELLQPFATTSEDRHPTLFAFAHQQLEGKGARVLSFGCSTGEEPCSIAQYLPDAVIDAIDINPRSIAIAQRRAAKLGLANINFAVSGQPPQDQSQYDAVFCLSVLRDGRLDADLPKSCAAIFPFTKYEAAVSALDHVLRPGGLLFIWGSNFHFSDSSVAARYRPIEVPGTRPHKGAFYGPDNRLIDGATESQFVFEKLT